MRHRVHPAEHALRAGVLLQAAPRARRQHVVEVLSGPVQPDDQRPEASFRQLSDPAEQQVALAESEDDDGDAAQRPLRHGGARVDGRADVDEPVGAQRVLEEVPGDGVVVGDQRANARRPPLGDRGGGPGGGRQLPDYGHRDGPRPAPAGRMSGQFSST
ncbi:hypothetical protein CP974_29375 [Streptomyces fradiae ATCC 10745 = DSM 40063]|nr:hypothetical protein CP974_29375 [Streptomyces fradiae ATCC 10745 = DSM 40063]